VQEEFENTKGAMRIRQSMKFRQHNGQKKKGQKDKQRSTKHTHKTKDRVTRTPLNFFHYFHLGISSVPVTTKDVGLIPAYDEV